MTLKITIDHINAANTSTIPIAPTFGFFGCESSDVGVFAVHCKVFFVKLVCFIWKGCNIVGLSRLAENLVNI